MAEGKPPYADIHPMRVSSNCIPSYPENIVADTMAVLHDEQVKLDLVSGCTQKNDVSGGTLDCEKSRDKEARKIRGPRARLVGQRTREE